MRERTFGGAMRRNRVDRAAGQVVALAVLGWPLSAIAGEPWFESWDTWTNSGSIAAVVISLIALIATQQTTHAKTTREKREELKGLIEKLLEFRAEFDAKSGTFVNDAEREGWSVRLNTKKLIYLESAEYLARQLPHVTSAEWGVLAAEYDADSNFLKAEELYRRAVHAARKSSLVTQVAAVRALAGVQMRRGWRGAERGRASYRDAIEMLAAQRDPYSLYAVELTYRQWCYAEYNYAFDFRNAADRLGDALKILQKMPEQFPIKQIELRLCAALLLTMVSGLAGERDAWRDALANASALLAPLTDVASIQLRNRIDACLAEVAHQADGSLPTAPHAIALEDPPPGGGAIVPIPGIPQPLSSD